MGRAPLYTFCQLGVAVWLVGVGRCQSSSAADPSFRGFYIDDGVTNTLNCDEGFTYRTSASASETYARCCETGQPPMFVVGCSNGTLSWDNNDKVACPTQYTCLTVTMVSSYPETTSTAKDYLCGFEWPAETLYRALAVETPSSSVSSEESASASSGASSAGISSTSSQSSETLLRAPTAEPTATPPDAGSNEDGVSLTNEDDDNEDESSGSTSQAWIAGPVVGGIAAVGLLGGLAFWVSRKYRKAGPVDSPGSPELGPELPANPVKSMYAAHPPFDETPPPPPPKSSFVEMPVRPVYEMAGSEVRPPMTQVSPLSERAELYSPSSPRSRY